MDIRADLHLHTVASDGRWTPEELLSEVQRAGIGLFAVTDHDTLGSLDQVARLVSSTGLLFLPGVEVSARLDGQIYHLLVYGFDMDDPDLNVLIEENRALLTGAGDEITRRMIDAGYPIDWDEYTAYTWERRRGGWKALNFFIDSGYCHDVGSYFRDLMPSIDYPETLFAPPERVIAAGRAAGGTVSLAHPGADFYNGAGTERLDELVDMGMEGLECYSFHHNERQTRAYLDYCRSRDLLITGGSDYHGGFASRALGVPAIYASDLRLGRLEEQLIG